MTSNNSLIPKMHHLECVDSTMDEAIALYKSGQDVPIVVLAKNQRSGRGQHQRVWESGEGGMYLSVLLKPTQFEFDQVETLIQRVGYLLQQQILQATGIVADLKLPNDILIKGKKVAGILMEASTMAGSSRPDYINFGIGLNVNQTNFPPSIYENATSLCVETGSTYRIEEIAEQISASLIAAVQ